MKNIFILLCVVCLTGCVAGHKYNYKASSMDIPVKPSEQRTLILSVEDWRPYVLSGDKEPNFVGLQRGGFGEPWDVTTASGNPMTEDMSAAIVSGLKGAGYNVFNIPGKKEDAYLNRQANAFLTEISKTTGVKLKFLKPAFFKLKISSSVV